MNIPDLTLRDCFACAFLACGPCGSAESIAKNAYQLADAMLSARNNGSEPNPWREAVEGECAAVWSGWYPGDPAETVRALIDWHLSVERDPKVSESAAALVRYKEALTRLSESSDSAARFIAQQALAPTPSRAAGGTSHE